MSRHLLLQACALHKLRVYFGDVSSAFLQTSASEEHQELTIKAPPEVGYLFSDSEGKPFRYVRLMKPFSLPYTSSDICPMQPRYIGQTAPHTAFSCGEQVPDVAVPHYKDARMQHSQSR